MHHKHFSAYATLTVMAASGIASAVASHGPLPNDRGRPPLDFAGVDAPPLGDLGFSGQVIGVHMQDAEGILLIDAVSGQVLPEDKQGDGGSPAWATERGLAMAMLHERTKFYIDRTGNPAPTPEVLAFEDLSWLAIDPETSEETLLAADDEFRMDAIATYLGIDRETGDIKKALVEQTIAQDQTRTEGELAALTEAQHNASFDEYAKRQTGTNG